METQVLSLVLYGESQEKTWYAQAREIDFFSLKGLVESFSQQFQLNLKLVYHVEKPYLHPHQSFSIQHQGKEIGWAGMIHPAFAEANDLKPHGAVAEFSLESLLPQKTRYQGYSPFPYVERDIAVLVPQDQDWGGMSQIVKQNGGGLLTDISPFDVFSGKDLPKDKKSMAFRVRLQSMEKTLSDNDIQDTIEKIKSSLLSRCGAELR